MLRRSLAADGKSRAFINDEAVGVGLLKDLGGLLLEVHGQADDRGLFDIATHRGLLDAFRRAGDADGDGRGALSPNGTRRAQTLAGLKARAAEAETNADFVRAAAKELSDFRARSRARKKGLPANAP